MLHECMGMHSLMKAGRCHQHTPYKVLAKPALRMLNGVLTFYYGALNCSCYYGDSAPGGEAGGSRGVGDRGEPGPSLVPVGSYPYRRRARLAPDGREPWSKGALNGVTPSRCAESYQLPPVAIALPAPA